MKRTVFLIIACIVSVTLTGQAIFSPTSTGNSFALGNTVIYVDKSEEALVHLTATLLQKDIKSVTGITAEITATVPENTGTLILLGTIGKSALLQTLEAKKLVTTKEILNKWEAYHLQTISNPLKGITNAIVIAGADKRGLAYGVFEFSKQLGVSPWYWWADVPVEKKNAVFIKKNLSITDAPKVKYRGIFINDEAPALSGWTREKFGGFNHRLYEKVFELILRLKGNYIWPAMWGNAFYDDDSLNIQAANKYGIVIGTSHHEPLMRAHDEWRRHGTGKWNYDSNEAKLKEFWRAGMKRASNEKIVTVGMRGDGDEPMSRQTATALLERIVKDQRDIITEVTGKPASETPQLWALYKEVQDYYDKGMRVPDDVTLLLCDDNWGNIRRLPNPKEAPRKGGYGIYYHFDYVGGPRNYKWVNTNPLPRIWEQMNLAWEYNAREIWIVNVGDIKPMEYPISFFLDYAWNPERIKANDLETYSIQWAKAQFGNQYAKEIAGIMTKYGKYNGRRKPELLDANTYSFNYNEWPTVVNEYKTLLQEAEIINNKLPAEKRDAFFQLVLHPVKACSNLYDMYYNVALNQQAYAKKYAAANIYADKVKSLYLQDSLITLEYHRLNNGKWNHMMSQTHIGYTYWQQPNRQRMPMVRYVPADSVKEQQTESPVIAIRAAVPQREKGAAFYEDTQRGISIAADHYTNIYNSNTIKWTVIPDLGRTGSAITVMPVTAPSQQPGAGTPYVSYDIYTSSKGNFAINAYFSPTLNVQNTENGLSYAISVDDEQPQIISINKEDKNTGTGIWNKWVSESIIIKSTKHTINSPGKHTIKYWMVDPTVVLQKIVVDFGNNKPSYLGPSETIYQPNKK
ncbi:glycosyl hydrolase 115 family protein [Sediminibacterium sp.]|uniref:glycosyl hydrolase 115 family protein n=1 Tax=Sediminibacterium sp. TaxID=1917865 RepID=UPI0025F1EF4A|nr:glycosyl hydrolase 115 family protein [Sediminibacterium sp.]MBW0177921.1 glycosyl hydrolase 115 family protein [Sediminibacterium sp.]